MKKLLVILLILILSSITFAEVAHCWDITLRNPGSPTGQWNDKVALGNFNIDGINYERIVLPGAKLTISGFGSYNFLCDDGARTSSLGYYRTELNDYFAPNTQKSINGNGPGTAVSSGLAQCVGNPPRRGADIGIGNADQYVFNFGTTESDILNWIGPHTYTTTFVNNPTVGSYLGNGTTMQNASGNFYFAANPSVLIFSQNNDNLGFYEKDGNFIKEVYFTVNSKTVLDVNIENYQISCTNALCTVDQSQRGFIIKNNEIMILSGTVNINKNNIPKNIFYSLDLNYSVPQLKEYDYYKNGFNIKSNISEISAGYLDKQDFQVQIIGSADQASCIGEDGMTGATGSAIAPRINIGFGGSDGIVDSNECSPENDNWVYCSQREFMVLLGKQIESVFNKEFELANATTNADINQLFNEREQLRKMTLRVRDLDLRAIRNTELINTIQTSGLSFNPSNLATPAFGTTLTSQIPRIRNLFSNIEFLKEGGTSANKEYKVGEYIVEIDFSNSTFSSNELFNNDGNLSSGLNIKVNLIENGGKPLYDWFFYDNNVSDITSDSINFTTADLYSTNINNRGIIMTFNEEAGANNINNGNFYKTFISPIFVKVDGNNQSTNTFNLTHQQLANNFQGDVFSYWSGIASTLTNTCEDIKVGETALVYRQADYLTPKTPTTPATISIYGELAQLKNASEYLETVIYLPVDSAAPVNEKLTITGLGNIYTKNGLCTTSADGNCSIEVTSQGNTKITNLQEVFNGIANETVCVNSAQSGSNVNWTLFWNEAKILQELYNAKVTAIGENNICGELINPNN